MGYSRRTLAPHDGASGLLSPGSQPTASTDEPVDWLDLFPTEDESASVTNAGVSTFVVDSTPQIASEPQRRRRRSRRGRLQSTLRLVIRGVLLPFRLALRACRWLAAGAGRVAASFISGIHRGMTRTGVMISSSLRAVVRGVTALLLLPWRLTKRVLVAFRSARRWVFRLAGACQRAVVSAGAAFARTCRAAVDAAAHLCRRGLSNAASAAHAARSLVAASYHSAADFTRSLATRVRRTLVLFGASVQAVGHAIAVSLRAVVMLVRADIRVMRHWLQLTITRAVQLVVETIRGAYVLVRTIGQTASRTATLVFTSIVSGSQCAVAWVGHGVAAAWRASGRACLNVMTGCRNLAAAMSASWLRASRGLWRVIGKIAVGCRSAARSLVERLTGAIREAARAAQMSLVAAGHGVLACYSAVVGAGTTLVEFSSEIGRALRVMAADARSRTYVAGTAVGHQMVAIASRVERLLHDAASHSWRTASLETRHRLGVARAAETSVIEGVVRMSRTTARNLESTIVVLRVPAVEFSLPHLGRGHLVASALAMVVLLLVSSIFRVAHIPPRLAPAALGARVVPAQVRTRVLRAAAVTPLAPLAPAFYREGAATSRSATRPGVALIPTDHRAIRTVLNRYRDAMSTLNLAGLKTVWPNADSDAVRASFATLVDQNVEFNRCRIYPAATGATAACTGVIESGFSPGQRRPKVARARWEFRLQKAGRRWTITTVDTLMG